MGMVRDKIEPIIIVLCGLILFFTLTIIYTAHMFKDDGQLFQVFSNSLAGVTGALLMRVKPSKTTDDSIHITNQNDAPQTGAGA